MQPSPTWPRVEEPFHRTLVRNGIIALVVGAVFAVKQQRIGLLAPVALLACWFSLGGHYVEIAFLNGLRARLPAGRVVQLAARVLVWMGGGVVLYGGMVATAEVLPIRGPSLRMWWIGPLLLTGVELIAHAVLALKRRPSFYDGRG